MNPKEDRFLRKLAMLVGVLAATMTVLVVAALGNGAPIAAGQPTPTLRIKAGLGDGIVTVNQYISDPAFGESNTVRVTEGTTVVWTLGSDEPHTVTFRAGAPFPPYFVLQPEDPSRAPMLNPQLAFPTVPNGPWDGTTFIHMELQSRGQELPVTFARAGRYVYNCLFHEEMDGVVEVVPPESSGITTQAAIDQYAATHYADVHAPQVADMMATASRAERHDGPGGTSIWSVRAGTNWRRGHVDLQAFFPSALTVREGDTVLWYVDHIAPHTVTFPAADGPPPDFVAVQLPNGTLLPPPDPNQPPPPELMALFADPATQPRIVFPGATASQPSGVYDGRSLYNSGFIGEHPVVAYPIDKTWTLTFGTPGTYRYICLLHEPEGMEATITVLPRGS
jgi:plastocyanin